METRIRISENDAGINWAEVVGIIAAVGWGERDLHEMKAAFGRSGYKAFAFDGEKLVGFGRTIDDHRYYAHIVDVVVLPDYQRMGVGAAIIQNLQNRLQGFLSVTLTAAPQVQDFYKRFGFRMQTTAMMRPRSEQQAKDNCSS